MGRRLARVLSVVRDVVVILASLTIITSQYSRLGEEPVFLITISVSAVLAALCVVDLALVVARRGRGAQVGMAVVQLVVGLFWLLLFPPVGLIIIAPNIAALAALREKKTPEELLRHPPVPRTRNYLIAAGVGSLLLLASLLLPWFSAKGTTVSLFGVYTTIATHSGGLPSVSFGQLAVAFALLSLFCAPVAMVCSALGLRLRRLSLVSGILAVIVAAGSAVSLQGDAGVGPYIMVAAGVVNLIGFFVFRGAKPAPPEGG